MFSRPKPGETEEDLLKFQKQFLEENTTPSVNITKKAGDKRTAERDVVQLDASSTSASVTHPAPVAKKSKFKAAQELKAKVKQEKEKISGFQDNDIVDDHDRSSATVLSKIIERDTRNAVHCLPNPVELPFPSVSNVAANKAQKSGKKKKQSLFAQHFAKSPDKFTVGQDDTPSAIKVGMEMDTDDDHGTACSSSIVDGSGLSATFGKSEVKKIHEENIQQLSAMSEEEIVNEQQKLLQMLDPELIKFIKQRQTKSNSKTAEYQNRTETVDVKSTPKSQNKLNEPDVQVPVDIKKDWVHMDKIEYDKLEWMKDLPPPKTEGSKSGQTARFDFQGNLVQADADIPVNVGLHHHGDEPERAGYTLEELFTLARSTNVQQKVIALTTLSKIIKQAKEGNLSTLVQSPILPCIIDAGVIFLLRWSLDDNVESVMASTVAAFNALLVNHADEKALNKVFHWYQGNRVTCQASSEPESVGIKLPGDTDEKPEQTDADVAKHDGILALGTRMNFIQRLAYILDKVRPQAPTVIAILQILTKMCRHSRKMAYEVFKCSNLVDVITTQFLPATWKASDMSEPISNVYGVPLKEAMSLVCTMCQAGRNMASLLLSKYKIEERLMRFIITDVRDIGLPDIEAHGLQMACYNTWKVCLAYGLADNVFIETYPKIVERLTSHTDMIEQDIYTIERVSALISCLDMSVCVAVTPRKQQGFNNSEDTMEDIKEEPVLPDINWSHVADLIQPIRLLLQNSLNKIAFSYQIKKQSLQLPIACLNFITTYYIHCQSQLNGEDIVNSLQNMEQIYHDTLQHWGSIGFNYQMGSLCKHSNLVANNTEKNLEQSKCLPEYQNSSLLEEHLVPVVSKNSPIGFLSAFYRMIYHFSKVHPGLKTSDTETAISPYIILKSSDLKIYIEKIVDGRLSHLANNMFSRYELHLLYYVLKLAADMAMIKKCTIDLSTLHRLSLKLLSILQHGEEYIAHDLLSTIIFNPVFFSSQSTESTMMKLEGLNLSLPTHILSATTEELNIASEELISEAIKNLITIRAVYLASMSHSEQYVMFSR
ncbi:RNA polymerase II associated protein 1 [Mactra antiquata]